MTLRRPAAVYVCALRHVPDMAARTGALHLVSAIDAELAPQTPGSIARDRHLKLDMHDIIEARPGHTPPGSDHVERLIEFVHDWNREGPLLIHCFAGISRSTAAAFIALCTLNPKAPEDVIACAIRRSSDTAIPNRRFVALADAALKRDGRMVEALAKMGRNRAALECVPFEIGAHHHAPEPGRAGSQAA